MPRLFSTICCFLFIATLLAGCNPSHSNFTALRFEEYNFGLFLSETSPKEVSITGQLKFEMDGARVYKLEGSGEVKTSKHSIFIEGNKLIINDSITIMMENKPPYNMVLKEDGKVVEGFLHNWK